MGTQNLWLWNLFYITDFVIMAAALFLVNRFHISNEKSKKRMINS
jgi:hypothetical protein